VIFVEKMESMGTQRGRAKWRSNFMTTSARDEEVEHPVLRVKMRRFRARIMRAQQLSVFSLHLFTHLAQIVVY